MSEELQTRTEHSRSLEDAERYKAIQTLKELGLLISLEDTEIFHGRAVEEGEEGWTIDPSFLNGANDSGNSNVNNRPSLYTTDRQTAEDFARQRVREKSYSAHRSTGPIRKIEAQVHQIVAADMDACVIDFDFNDKDLSDEDSQRYKKALSALVLPVTEGSPVKFEDRESVSKIAVIIDKSGKKIIPHSDVEAIAEEAGVDIPLAIHLVSAFNARTLALLKPSFLVSELIKNAEGVANVGMDLEGERQDVPINMEYVQRYLRMAHVVGVRQRVSSATLGREVESFSLFDLSKISTKEGLEESREKTFRRLGSFSMLLDQHAPLERNHSRLARLLGDAHAKPEDLIEAAKDVEGFKEIFDMDAGNWEGFTLGEHTETVLRNLEESYADALPVQMLEPIRLALIVHDLGKSIAVARGEKNKEKDYNESYANEFLTKLNVDVRLQKVILSAIGKGSQLAYEANVRRNNQARDELKRFTQLTLEEIYGESGVSAEQVAGFITMCGVIQVCDGGAYTSMATTRRSDGNGRHRNAPSFNHSFASPIDFGQRSIRLKSKNGKAAESDLTPTMSNGPRSRLRVSRSGAGRRQPKI